LTGTARDETKVAHSSMGILMNRYPTFNTESKKLVPRAIDVETLSEQLIPIRDAFLKVFDGARARSRGELHRLELGLTITEQGTIAFTVGDARPTLTLTLESRPRSPSARSTAKSGAGKQPDVVEIDPPRPESRLSAARRSAEVRSVVVDEG